VCIQELMYLSRTPGVEPVERTTAGFLLQNKVSQLSKLLEPLVLTVSAKHASKALIFIRD